VSLRAALPALAAEITPGAIAFTQKDGLWIRSLTSPPERLVTAPNVEAPRFSPSGKWIAYFRDQALYVVARSGGQPFPLGKAIRGSIAPGAEWLPGRDELLVEDASGVKAFSGTNRWSRAVRQMPHVTLPVLVSPDGKEMVYADAITRSRGLAGEPMRAGRLCRMALASSDPPAILFSQYLNGAIACLWSGDGEQILFWVDPDFSASLAADGLDLYRVPAGGGTPQPVGVTSLLYEDMLSLSHDGTRLAICDGAGRYHWQQKRIATVNLKTWKVDYLTGKNTAAVTPSWSPAGDRIAYSAAPEPAPGANVGGGDAAKALLAKRRIWVASAPGGAPKQLTGDERYRDEKPMWSADGGQILFCRIDAANDRTLWLMEAENPNPLLVAGPLRPGEDWFGYYGYLDWRGMFDWYRGA
jgi:dipeptidyl aminopeptidase/acylaminoacyl peptidase